MGTGGAERSLFNLLKGPLGTAFRHNVISLTTFGTYGKQLRDIGYEVTALDIKHAPWRFGRLRGLVRRQQPDIVQGWMYHGNLAASFACPSSVRLVWNVRHGLEDFAGEKRTTQLAIQANRMISARPDRVLFNAEIARRQHIKLGFTEENTQVIPNGFDTELFRFDPYQRAQLRQQLGISATAPVIGHLGRFHPVKDHDTFLKASLRVLADRSDVHLVLAGYGVSYETPFFNERILGALRPRVHLLEDRRDVSAVLSAMDIFAQSSRVEGFPNVLGEAMSTERACVATDVGDSAFVLADAGLIVPPEDSAALEAGMRKFLSDPELRIKSGTQARKRVKTDFPLDGTAQAYINLYRSFF
nr:glycosyltransferase [Sulfitobacter pontiacus]